MAQMPAIIDTAGRPLASMTAHYGADLMSNELRGWYPPEQSGDADLLPELSTLRSRTQDLIRNHGLTSGAVQTHLDNIIGPNLRISLKPNHHRLGIKAEAAATWSRETEAKFYEYTHDPDCYCDASERHSMNGLLQLAYRSYLTSFESLATVEWIKDRPGARYKTAFQAIDPARLSNPQGSADTDKLRAGVALGNMGQPVGYWIASHMEGDPQGPLTMVEHKYVPRATPWGRRLVVHVFDGERPGQTRGKTGIVSVIAKTKMLEKLEQATLQASILNAMYAAVVESPVAWELIGASLGAENSRAKRVEGVSKYMQDRGQWHKDGFIRYNGVKIPHLYPGEELKLLQPQHPSAAFASFEEATLRHLAGGFNMTYEQFSRDYSKTNYSSARAAMIEAWRFFSGRRHFIAGAIATQYFTAWLEEAMDSGEVETPAGAPDFWDAKSAYTQCQWIGPGKGHIDPLKEENATTIALSNKTTTLEKECAERGLDWEETLEQGIREEAREKSLREEYGLGPAAPLPGAAPQAAGDSEPETDEEIQEALDAGDITEEEAEELRERNRSDGTADPEDEEDTSDE